MLIKRGVYQTIGGLDEWFGLGHFDDDDLAVRASQAGFDLAVAHELFIHHLGSRTFAGNGINAEALLQENGRRFAEKWGLGSGGWRVVSREQPKGTGARLRSGPGADSPRWGQDRSRHG